MTAGRAGPVIIPHLSATTFLDDRSIQTVSLDRFSSRFADRLYQFFPRHFLRGLRAGHVVNLLLDNGAVKVVNTVAQ